MALSLTEQFKAFVAGKPADEAYNYSSNLNCPFAQFLRETGIARHVSVGGADWTKWHLFGAWPGRSRPIPDHIAVALCRYPHRYGALLTRLESVEG